MATETVSKGAPWVVEFLDRTYGHPTATTKIKCNDSTGRIEDGTGQPFLIGNPLLTIVAAGVAAAGPVTATGVNVGDKIFGVLNLTDNATGATAFQSTVTVKNQIQQTSASDLSTKTYAFLVVKQS